REELLGARGVRALSLGIGKIVRQIGADDDQRLRASPELLEDAGDLVGGRVPDRQRDYRERAQRDLEERQLHLERVLLGVGSPIVRQRDLLDGNVSQWSAHGGGAGEREPAQGPE